MHGLILFGDINRMLTAVQPKMEIENKTYPVLGCRKSAEMAAECINITALSIIDKFVDITGVTLTFKIISTSLLAVPFHLENTGLVDGLMGYEYCHVAFDDLPAIKSALHSNTA
ncbi:hypothetical protein JW979_10680 [bacterium]|nr:hypothetical protein [candidate division CSSED10-310 bacterium]